MLSQNILARSSLSPLSRSWRSPLLKAWGIPLSLPISPSVSVSQILFCFVCDCFAWMCVYTPSACSVWIQKIASDSLKLELQTIVGRHVSAGIWTRVFWKSSQRSWPLSHLSNPLVCCFVIFSFRDRVSYIPGWTGTRQIASDNSGLLFPLPVPPKCRLWVCASMAGFMQCSEPDQSFPRVKHALCQLSCIPRPNLLRSPCFPTNPEIRKLSTIVG